MGQSFSWIGQVCSDNVSIPLRNDTHRTSRSYASVDYNRRELKADRSPTALKHIRHKVGNNSVFSLPSKVPQDYRQHLEREYKLDAKIGQGAFGKVFSATQKSSGMRFAIKEMQLSPPRIGKKKKKGTVQYKRVRTEVEVMKNLDHPNIVSLYEIIEAPKVVYLVMELCTGGELFDKIVSSGSFSEPLAAQLTAQIMKPVRYLHLRRIMHRDLKPENFIFQRPGPIDQSTLKLIDFGMSQPFLLGPGMPSRRSMVGTTYYVAPQVLQGIYDERIDVWSVGVILYIMLTGSPPFDGASEKVVLRRVRKGDISHIDQSSSISPEGKDLLKRLLTYDPERRISMADALQHPWINAEDKDKRSQELPVVILDRLQAFRRVGKFKQACMHVIASRSLNTDDSDIRQLHETFQKWDVNHDGVLSMQELKDGMQASGYLGIERSDYEDLVASIDIDGSGVIDYTEFLAATLDERQFLREDKLLSTFHLFDRDGDGKITKDELESVLMNDKVNVGALMSEFDANCDGVIDFSEFKAIIQRTFSQDMSESGVESPVGPSPISDCSFRCPRDFAVGA